MALDALLARLESRTVTSVTSDKTLDVTPRPAQIVVCTSVTSVTAQNDVKASNDASGRAFTFSPPGDPANDDEALQERVAIMMESGIDADTALREARWNADRERCWRGLLRNAQHILNAPLSQRGDLLAQYRKEAIRRNGDLTGDNMADSLRAWIAARLQ